MKEEDSYHNFLRTQEQKFVVMVILTQKTTAELETITVGEELVWTTKQLTMKLCLEEPTFFVVKVDFSNYLYTNETCIWAALIVPLFVSLFLASQLFEKKAIYD